MELIDALIAVATVMLTCCEVLEFDASTNWIVKLYVPAVVGEPSISTALKVATVKTSPGGSVPDDTLQLNGVLPFIPLMALLYAAPTVALGRVTLGIVGSGTVYMVSVATWVVSAIEVAVKVAGTPCVVGAV